MTIKFTKACGRAAAPVGGPLRSLSSPRLSARADTFATTGEKAMAVKATISPSVQARRLFGQLVARADDTTGVVDINACCELAILRDRRGETPSASDELSELLTERWLEPDPDGGGWLTLLD